MRHTVRPWIVAAMLVSVLAVLGWAAQAALSARNDLLEVRGIVTQLRNDVTVGSVTAGADPVELRRRLQPAAEAAAAARRTMSQPGPALVARLPLLGRPLAAERDLALAADALLRTATSVLTDVERLQLAQGRVDLPALEQVAAALQRGGHELEQPLRRLERGAIGPVPASVRGAVAQARSELSGLDRHLLRAAAATRSLAGVLGADGPRAVVVVLMNNAELRGAGGYGGSFALMQADAGRLRIGPFQDVNDVQAPPAQARRVSAPPDYAARWGPYLANSTLWKNTLMSADQPTSSAVTCEVVRLAPGAPCDAVLLLDVPALARLVELTGPVDLGAGPSVEGQDLVRALLVEAYAQPDATAGDQAARRQRLRTAADEGVSSLLGARMAGADTLRVLTDAVLGRHLAVWSARPHEQQALTDVGLAGSVDPHGADLSLVAVNQFSAGKLDYYVNRSVGLLAVVGDSQAQVTQKVTLQLDAPPDLPGYVLGPRGARLDELMDIALSPDAQDVVLRVNGREVPALVVSEDGSLRVEVQVVLGLGQRASWEVSYRVPLDDGRYRLRLLPQPLARDAVLHLAVVAAPGQRLQDGDITYDGAHDRSRSIDVRLAAQP